MWQECLLSCKVIKFEIPLQSFQGAWDAGTPDLGIGIRYIPNRFWQEYFNHFPETHFYARDWPNSGDFYYIQFWYSPP